MSVGSLVSAHCRSPVCAGAMGTLLLIYLFPLDDIYVCLGTQLRNRTLAQYMEDLEFIFLNRPLK